ncbi:MAG: tetratricopeptide repeat protein [Planctomycetes bacterium]|nr:tetratricopeptide repeat protein [Planctomycetota bacterium]
MARWSSRKSDLAGILWIAIPICLLCGARLTAAGSIDDCRRLLREGQYAECLETARQTIKDGAYQSDWRILELEAMLALGRYPEAAQYVETALRESRADLRLLRLAHIAYLHNGQSREASTILSTISRIGSYRRIEYLAGSEAVALGQSLLLLGAEPRLVLQNFYTPVIKNDPNCREAYLAAGELALAKQDFELAAEQYRNALKRFGNDPDAQVGLARAFYYSDRSEMVAALDAALVVNPRHAPSLILLAEHQIDSEDYAGADKTLARVLAVNPWHPQAWAYQAVLAHLTNDPNAAAGRRANGLKFWPTNPEVDYLIGRKLSQNYRFAEGAAFQRQAIKSDPACLPARIQLAQDLLRLGDEKQGWVLADEVNKKDPYNVEAYNLTHLRDTLTGFRTISEDGLLLKMENHEADVYGDQVMALLKKAKTELCKKYGFEPHGPITVELFPNQQDFAVRTFGMPGGDGFLGVCFGDVVTATSPQPQRHTNWQATLWHEFAHVVTLNLTKNKMPRWLSEGISVYEELQRDPTWGQRMTPQYRKMILDGEMTPVGKLSTAFMSPPSPMHLQFAYYQASLVVEFLVERSGFESIKAILADLAKGEEINAAIAKYAGNLERIERDFDAFARKRAEGLAPGVDWEQPSQDQLDPVDPDAVARWLAQHPNNFWALGLHARNLIAERKWEEAKVPLLKQISLYPGYVGPENAYELLAQVHRNLGETAQETQVLGNLAKLSADAADAYARLMEIGTEQKDWEQVAENGSRYLAVYPMLSDTYWRLGRAYEELKRDEPAVHAYSRLLLLDPSDPVDIHYRVAKLLQKQNPTTAKRHILEALADAPRFREGHRLLLSLPEGDIPTTEGASQ